MFLLRTFGALQLTRDNGASITGAAAQRRPLLILALAALVPGGIPRERLLHALWPTVDRDRARATLKQHLYALRRATGDATLVTGSPRLRVASDRLRIDALELVAHVDRGRPRDAIALLQGELLEDVMATAGDPLRDLVREIREAFAPKIALVRQAIAAQRGLPAVAPIGKVTAAISAERELAAAARRFVRGLATLPEDGLAAHHRAAWSSHDLLEALAATERAQVPPERIRDLIAESEPIWRRSQLVERMLLSPPGQPGHVETVEWLLEGGLRTVEPSGRALESHLLDSGVATQMRLRYRWESRQLAGAALACGRELRVLMLAPRSARDLAAVAPILARASATVVVSDADADGLALARLGLVVPGVRMVGVPGDAFDELAHLATLGPFDVILAGATLDQLAARSATWLTEHLLGMLAPGGTLCLSSLMVRNLHGPWFRHIVNWTVIERDQDDMLVLAGEAAGECDISWDRDPIGCTWLVAMRKRLPAIAARDRAAA